MLLLLAVILFSVIHLVPVWAPGVRAGLAAKIGDKPTKGLIAVGLLLSVYLITLGWKSADVAVLYDPPIGLRHINTLFTALAFILFVSSNLKTWFGTFIRNQQLTAVKVWAVGHLIANGDSRSLILFGGLLIWSVLMVIGIKKRDGVWNRQQRQASPIASILAVIVGVGIWYLVANSHAYLFGVPALPWK